ncbi:MAG: AraC family ligand binding domain-containing protein, partial [Planctomycetota bacterium JB042]
MRGEAKLRPGRFYGLVVRDRRVGGLRFNETEYAPGTQIPRHAHERAYLCLVRRGEYVERFGRRGRECGPQTVAFHPPGEEHDERIRETEVRSFNVEFEADWLERVGVSPARLAAGEASPGGPATWGACALYRDVLAGAADLDLEARTAALARALGGEHDAPARR